MEAWLDCGVRDASGDAGTLKRFPVYFLMWVFGVPMSGGRVVSSINHSMRTLLMKGCPCFRDPGATWRMDGGALLVARMFRFRVRTASPDCFF